MAKIQSGRDAPIGPGIAYRPIHFYVTDDRNDAIRSTLVLSQKTKEQVATNSGGLTNPLMLGPGDKVLITRSGYTSQEVVVDQEGFKIGLIDVVLRRQQHAEDR